MEGTNKFTKKRNRDNSKNRSKSLNRNFSKSRDFSQKKKGFGLKFQRNNKFSDGKKFKKSFEKNFDNNFEDDMGYDNENRIQSNKKDDVIKIAKYWVPKQIIEPVNTQGKIAISEENNYLFSIVGNELKILDLYTYAVIKSFNQPEETFVAFNYNAKKNEIVCAMNNSLIRVFDITSGKCIKTWKLSKANAKLISFDKSYKFVALATTSHTILVYDCSNYNLVCNFEAHSNFIYDLKFNPEAEKYLLYSCSEDGTIKSWDVVLNKQTAVLNKHEKGVRHLDLTNDGKSLISVSIDNHIIMWKLQTAEILREYRLDMIPPIETIFYFTRKATSKEGEKELSPTLLAGCEDGSLLEINFKKKQVNDFSLRVNFLNQPISQIIYTPDANRILCLTAEQSLIYLDIDLVKENITHAKLQKLIPGFCQEILDVKLLPVPSLNEIERKNKIENSKNNKADNNQNHPVNENKVNVGDDDDEDNTNNKLDKNLIYDNLEYIFSSNDATLKYFSKSKIKLFEGHTDFIMSIDIKGSFIVTASKDNTIRLWKYYYESSSGENESENENEIKKNNGNNDKEFKCVCFAVLKGHSEQVNCSSLILKKGFQVVSASKDKSVKVWDFAELVKNYDLEDENGFLNITEAFTIDESVYSEIPHDEEINMIRVSPNEKLIATCSYDKTIKILNRHLEEMACLKGHKRAVMDVQYSKYAKLLASAAMDKTVKIWNLSDYTCLNTFEGHLTGVLKISWVYFGTHLVSAGSDGLIKFWNLKSSECINTIDAHQGKIWALDVNNQDEKNPIIVSGATDSRIIQWKDETEEKQEKELKEIEDRLIKEEQLRHLTYNNNLLKALELSLDLSRKSDFISILKKIINQRLKGTQENQEANILNFLNGNADSHIDLIIQNRKKMEELSDESNNNHINDLALNENNNFDFETEKEKENLKKLIMDKEIARIIMDPARFHLVLEIIRDNNVKSSSFFWVQILLKIILIRKNYEEYSYKNKEAKVGIKNKGFKKIKKKVEEIKNIDYMENFEIIKAYSEKHYERINREITKAYLLDFVLDKIKMV